MHTIKQEISVAAQVRHDTRLIFAQAPVSQEVCTGMTRRSGLVVIAIPVEEFRRRSRLPFVRKVPIGVVVWCDLPVGTHPLLLVEPVDRWEDSVVLRG